MRYAVVIEAADGNYSAYVPDLPGCIATGSTIPEVEVGIRNAIRLHIDGLKADGMAVPARERADRRPRARAVDRIGLRRRPAGLLKGIRR